MKPELHYSVDLYDFSHTYIYVHVYGIGCVNTWKKTAQNIRGYTDIFTG